MKGDAQHAEDLLLACEQAGAIRPLDRHFALRLARRAGCHETELILAAAWASHRLGQGHVCAVLPDVAGQPLFPENGDSGPIAPALPAWRGALRATRVVGAPGDYRPLILDEADRLYLHRYFEYERQVAADIARRCADVQGVDLDRLRGSLARLFPDDHSGDESLQRGVAGQKQAAALAVLRRFAVISGGPGTGKTTTVTKLLALLIEQQPRARIALAAPTGKAAARLSESLRAKKSDLLGAARIGEDTVHAIPEQASTLHRLLGTRPGSQRFRHDADDPLPLDILVVDEASMIDLPLMARLLTALPPAARLILLGDMHQLASVEAGQVFGDICGRDVPRVYSPAFAARIGSATGRTPSACDAARWVPATADSIALLGESFRFGRDSGIGHLARAVNEGDRTACRAYLTEQRFSDIEWCEVGAAGMAAFLAARVLPQLRAYLASPGAAEALRAFERFRILCAVRDGPYGVQQLNQLIERELTRREGLQGTERWYRGRPIMIRENHYGLRLFNGDIGLIWNDDDSGGALRAFFVDAEGGLRKLLPSRLPDHETVYAMTVHKSQGSEFDHVLLLLPEQQAPVLTRELLYTGLTRARTRVLLCGNRPIFEWAIGNTVERSSGLADRLATEVR